MVMAYNFFNGNSLTIGGTGASSGSNRVNRGGSWNNDASNCSVAYRNNNNPNNRNNNLGFRVVRSAQHPFIWLRGYRSFRGKGFFPTRRSF
ncbi:MAG: SUMF1/EgtB/PvdO family nonheme iron enzyme [Treponema sp.]|nr:SUMF1/EgtB/PvdO family nonheme iron enzyme [Treponema sp.]